MRLLLPSGLCDTLSTDLNSRITQIHLIFNCQFKSFMLTLRRVLKQLRAINSLSYIQSWNVQHQESRFKQRLEPLRILNYFRYTRVRLKATIYMCVS